MHGVILQLSAQLGQGVSFLKVEMLVSPQDGKAQADWHCDQGFRNVEIE